MANQADRRAATRAKLIHAAIHHFAEHGFEDTHTSAILEDAGVSRGAMYHHFPSKQALFEAVFLHVSETAIAAANEAGAGKASPLQALLAGCHGWLKAAEDKVVASILLEQGPQVLGWARARELEEASSLGLVKRGLFRAQHAGEIDAASIELTARLLNAALAEIALARLHLNPPPSQADQTAMLKQVFRGIKAKGA